MVTSSFRFRALAEAYRDIALRHLQAARLLLPHSVYDIVVFHCYHVVESISCAALAIWGEDATGIKTHRTKLERFRSYIAQTGRPFAQQATALTIELEGIRNTSLYPEGSPLDPLAKFTPTQAADILQRVDSFVGRLQANLGI